MGFMKSWLAGSFDQKVIGRVLELVQTRKASTGSMTVYVTGTLHEVCGKRLHVRN